MATLGAMMIDPSTARRVIGTVKPDDFYRETHQNLFVAFCKVLESGKPLDMVTIPEALGEKRIEEAGGVVYLWEIAEACPTSHSAEHYAEIVADLSALRRASEVCRQGDRLVYQEGIEPKEKLDWLQSQFSSIRTGRKPWASAFDIAQSLKKSRPQALATCWPSFDRATSFRGLTRGEPHLIQADTGLGKSLLVSQLAKLWAIDQALRVVVVSLEMTKEFTVRRMLFQMTGYWSVEDAQDAGIGPYEDYANAVKQFEFADFDVFDYSGSSLTEDRSIQTVLADLSAYMAVRPVDAVLIDYVQLLTRRGSRGGFADHNQNAHDLKWFAKSTGVCLVQASQVKMSQGRLQNRGGQEYEDAAGTVLKLTNEENEGYRLNATKTRHGKKSYTDLDLDERRLVFSERESTVTKVYRGGE